MIASYLSVQELRSCRLVCKLWSKEMKRAIVKRKCVVVSDETDCPEAKELLLAKKAGNNVNISTLVVLEIPLESRIIQKLLWNFADTMSGLKLDDCYPTAQEIYSVLKQLPCLETFSLKSTVSPLRQRRQSAALLDQLVSNSFSPRLQLNHLRKLSWEDCKPIDALYKLPLVCPNLKFLKLYLLGKCETKNFVGLKWSSLKTLMLTAAEDFTTSHFESLIVLDMNLQRLHLQNIKPGGQKRTRTLQKFLAAQGPSLYELFLFETVTLPYGVRNRDGNNRSTVSRFSPFPIQTPLLKYLRIDFRFINSLQFIDEVPSLRKLDCSSQSYLNWWTVLFKHQLPKPNEQLQELSIGAIDADCLKRMAMVFPNVTRLDISEDRVGDWALRTIFQHMGKLISLKISLCRSRNVQGLCITDSGITGIPLPDCERLLEDKDASEEKADSLRINPFVGDLKGTWVA
jgi:hypothetical protein